QLLTEIKQEFNGLEVSLQFLLKEPTIEKISKFLAMEATERNKKHSLQENISFLKTPDNPSLGLFCFPNSSSYATGEMFAPLAACLPDSIEVMAANMP
ncbi:hypothetical protein NL518_27570, partial [Klebsiella pneumoniae]|nr:hypothetical protein [Klebsiella pneumoniae]